MPLSCSPGGASLCALWSSCAALCVGVLWLVGVGLVVCCGGWVAKSVVGVTLCGFDVGGWGGVGLCFVAAALVVGLWWLPCLVVVPFWVLWLGVGCCL